MVPWPKLLIRFPWGLPGGKALAEGGGWAESLLQSLMGVCVWGGAVGWGGASL